MMTLGQASWLHENVNLLAALTLVAVFSLGAWLVLWHAAYDQNPIATLIAESLYTQQQSQ